MINLQRSLLFLLFAPLCLAIHDPEWKLATVVTSASLRPNTALEIPIYAPSGLPVADVPGVQLMAIQSSQLALIGEKTAIIIDKPGQTPKPAKKGVLQLNSHPDCVLTPTHTVMYYQENKLLHVLDDNGEVCKLPVVGQEALHPEK